MSCEMWNHPLQSEYVLLSPPNVRRPGHLLNTISLESSLLPLHLSVNRVTSTPWSQHSATCSWVKLATSGHATPWAYPLMAPPPETKYRCHQQRLWNLRCYFISRHGGCMTEHGGWPELVSSILYTRWPWRGHLSRGETSYPPRHSLTSSSTSSTWQHTTPSTQ